MFSRLSILSLAFVATLCGAVPVEERNGEHVYPGWDKLKYLFFFGPNWAGYLTTTFNRSELLTYNLAYGGATVNSTLVKPYLPTVLSFADQVQTLFLPKLSPKAPTPLTPAWESENSLFLVWIGVNDVANSYQNGDYANFHGILMDEYFRILEELYYAGARNFLLLNVPPIDRSPLTIGKGDQEVLLEREALESYNGALEDGLHRFKRSHGGVYGKVFDTAEVFTRILDGPGWYDIKNTTAYCEQYKNGTPEWDTYYPECGVKVSEYFWLNSLHPTWPVHKVLAEEIVKSL
ncbi:Carbohydrate Esterase Family 16 protein [Tuber magnatum]|uniref:Carbohydrate Esterase Family 16 protein n=1 Tax=Tuber magnatum TaxID=42249 RepID=A0A317T3S4_9PEZI|nr:Carbohydrate Esterase Family 16 protein [Tuber magnatum]